MFQNYKMFNRCINYMFKTVLRTSRTYIYLIIAPLIFITFIYFLWYESMLKTNRYIMLSAFTLIPTLFLLFLVSFIICEWRESIFLKYLRNFGITKLQFMLALLIVLFIITFVSIFLIISYLFLIDLTKKEHLMQLWILNMQIFSQWFGFFFGIILDIILMFFLSLLVAGSLKNVYLIQTINLLIFLLSLVFGDFFIDFPFATSLPVVTIGYFVPQKYLTWIVYIFYTKSDQNNYGFFLIVPAVDQNLSFTSIYLPVFGTLIFITLLEVSAYFTFVSSLKK